MKPPASSLLLPFEILVNRCIAQDARLSERIARHAGKTLGLTLTSPPLQFYLHFYPASVVLSFENESADAEERHGPGTEQEAAVKDATQSVSAPDGGISGSALAMLQLLLNKGGERALVNPAIQVSGDSEFVESVHGLFRDLEIDWQEPLSRIIGDVPTYGLERFFSGLGAFTRDTARSVRRNLDEYLHEEARLVPPLNQVAGFDSDLDALRLRLDRLQARIDQLGKWLAALESDSGN
jgi:ubiquinone biosynthesis protein UbiJ